MTTVASSDSAGSQLELGMSAAPAAMAGVCIYSKATSSQLWQAGQPARYLYLICSEEKVGRFNSVVGDHVDF